MTCGAVTRETVTCKTSSEAVTCRAITLENLGNSDFKEMAYDAVMRVAERDVWQRREQTFTTLSVKKKSKVRHSILFSKTLGTK